MSSLLVVPAVYVLDGLHLRGQREKPLGTACHHKNEPAPESLSSPFRQKVLTYRNLRVTMVTSLCLTG
jgi:hypothetical protein